VLALADLCFKRTSPRGKKEKKDDEKNVTARKTMSTAKLRYLQAISPKAGGEAQSGPPRPDGEPWRRGRTPTSASASSGGASASSRGFDNSSNRGMTTRSAGTTAEMTSPSMTPTATSANATPSPRFRRDAGGTSGAAPGGSGGAAGVGSGGSSASGSSGNAPAAKKMSSKKLKSPPASSSSGSGSKGRSRALEARMSAAMAIYATSDPPATLLSDDDYFTADGTLDVDKLEAGGIITPTNAINAARTGAPRPPTLGEIEEHMSNVDVMDPSTAAAMMVQPQPQPQSMEDAASPHHPTGGTVATNGTTSAAGRRSGFFEESFEEAFPPTPATAATTNDKLFLHDPFGTMPSLQQQQQQPTSDGGAAAAEPSSTTSVAAKRRARKNLAVSTVRSPVAGGTPMAENSYSHRGVAAAAATPTPTSPASMLDFALQGTPVADAGGDGDEASAFDFGRSGTNQGGGGGGGGGNAVLQTAEAAAGKERKIDDDDDDQEVGDSPSRPLTQQEEEERQEYAKKKGFLSKMISRGKKGKMSRSGLTPRKKPGTPEFASVKGSGAAAGTAAAVSRSPAADNAEPATTSPMSMTKSPRTGGSPPSAPTSLKPTGMLSASEESSVQRPIDNGNSPAAIRTEDASREEPVHDDPPLFVVNDLNADDSSDEENLVEGANRLESAMKELRSVTSNDGGEKAKGEAVPSLDRNAGRSITPPPMNHDEVEASRSPRREFDEVQNPVYSFPLGRDTSVKSIAREESEPPSWRTREEANSLNWRTREESESLYWKPRESSPYTAEGNMVSSSSEGAPSTFSQEERKDKAISQRATLSGRGLRTLSGKKNSRQQEPSSSSVLSISNANKPPSILRKSADLRQYDMDVPSMDPIQRAGIRLLSAAAVPIQTEVRRCLAQNKAANRLRALVLIQAYVRRWLPERRLRESIVAATRIQALFRGWLTRDTLEDKHYCATQIQRAWRGYAGQLSYQFDIVDIIIVQSIARRKMACRRAADAKQQLREQAAIKISSTWRSYDCTMNYLHTLADILIVQSVVRRWKAMRDFPVFREERRNDCATQIQKLVRGHMSRNQLMWYFSATEIQSCWRRYSAMNEYRRFRAAGTIQRWWRGCVARRELKAKREQNAAVVVQRNWRAYVCHTDFIFTVADIVIAQRTVRHWLAVRRVTELRERQAATKIQSHYRAHSCHMTYLYSLVNIIIVQSVVRRRLVVKEYPRLLMEQEASTRLQAAWRGHAVRASDSAAAKRDAAVILQKSWRGYWEYTSFVLLRHGVIEAQALVRGHQERDWLTFQHDCASVVQSSARSYIVKKRAKEERYAILAVNAAATGTRMKIAACKIQRCWRHCSRTEQEKNAALVIERFFISVKEEVDREMARIELSQKEKRQKRRRKKNEHEDKLLERVWLNTVHESDDRKGSIDKTRNRSASKKNEEARRERKVKKVEASNVERSSNAFPPTETIHADDNSEVSGITSPSVFAKETILPSPSRFKNLSRKELRDDLSLEEAWIDTEVHQAKQKLMSEKKYIKRHGLDRSGGSVMSSRHNSTKLPPDERRGSGTGARKVGKSGDRQSYRKSSRRGSSQRSTGRGSSSTTKEVDDSVSP